MVVCDVCPRVYEARAGVKLTGSGRDVCVVCQRGAKARGYVVEWRGIDGLYRFEGGDMRR